MQQYSHMIILENSAALNVLLKRAPEGTGVIAGGPARSGYSSWQVSKTSVQNLWVPDNKQNVVLATIEGLKSAEDSGRSS